MEPFTLNSTPKAARKKLKIDAPRHVQPLMFLGSHCPTSSICSIRTSISASLSPRSPSNDRGSLP